MAFDEATLQKDDEGDEHLFTTQDDNLQIFQSKNDIIDYLDLEKLTSTMDQGLDDMSQATQVIDQNFNETTSKTIGKAQGVQGESKMPHLSQSRKRINMPQKLHN